MVWDEQGSEKDLKSIGSGVLHAPSTWVRIAATVLLHVYCMCLRWIDKVSMSGGCPRYP